MLQHGKTGSPPKILDGNLAPLRTGNSGEQLIGQLHGRYFEQTQRGNIFSASAVAVTAVAAAQANVGLQLWNPPNSTVNLVILKATVYVIVTAASMTSVTLNGGLGQLAAPITTTVVASASGPTKVGSGLVSQAIAYNAGTYTNAPAVIWPMLKNTAAISATGEDSGGYIDFEGSIICAPGNYLAICPVGANAGTNGLTASIMWEEVSI